MSCSNATSPINITKNTDSICDLKCEYSFNYPSTNLQVVNRGEYLSFRTDPSQQPPVIFNANKYDVNEIRLYSPSLHTYGGKNSEAELIISHNNLSGNGNLLVCIPITISTSKTEASRLLETILSQVSKTANSIEEQTTINLPTFTLDKIVPKKPFYSYKGTLPYRPCNSNNNYVVFHKEDAIYLPITSFIQLSKIITKQSYSIHNVKGGLYYNKNGPKIHKGITGDDDIYIECQPTGSDGEVIITKDTPLFGDVITKEMLNQSIGNKFIGIIIGITLMVGLIKLANILISKLSGNGTKIQVGGENVINPVKTLKVLSKLSKK